MHRDHLSAVLAALREAVDERLWLADHIEFALGLIETGHADEGVAALGRLVDYLREQGGDTGPGFDF